MGGAPGRSPRHRPAAVPVRRRHHPRPRASRVLGRQAAGRPARPRLRDGGAQLHQPGRTRPGARLRVLLPTPLPVRRRQRPAAPDRRRRRWHHAGAPGRARAGRRHRDAAWQADRRRGAGHPAEAAWAHLARPQPPGALHPALSRRGRRVAHGRPHRLRATTLLAPPAARHHCRAGAGLAHPARRRPVRPRPGPPRRRGRLPRRLRQLPADLAPLPPQPGLGTPAAPAVAAFYMAATIHSALQHHRGRGAVWKRRSYGEVGL